MTQLTLCLKSHVLLPLKLPNDYLASFVFVLVFVGLARVLGLDMSMFTNDNLSTSLI